MSNVTQSQKPMSKNVFLKAIVHIMHSTGGKKK